MNSLKRHMFETRHTPDYAATSDKLPRLSQDLIGRELLHAPVYSDNRDDTVEIDTVENITCVNGFSKPGGLLWRRPAVSIRDDCASRSTCDTDENITKETYVSNEMLMDAVDYIWSMRGLSMSRSLNNTSIFRHKSFDREAFTQRVIDMFHLDESTISPTLRFINDWSVAGVLCSVTETASFSCGDDIVVGSIKRKILGPVAIEPSDTVGHGERTARFHIPSDAIVDIDELLRQRNRQSAMFTFWSTRSFDHIRKTASHEDNHLPVKFYIVVYDVPMAILRALGGHRDSDAFVRDNSSHPIISMAIVRSTSYKFHAIMDDVKREMLEHYHETAGNSDDDERVTEYRGTYFVACIEIGHAMPVAMNRSRFNIDTDSETNRPIMTVNDFRVDLSNSRWITRYVCGGKISVGHDNAHGVINQPVVDNGRYLNRSSCDDTPSTSNASTSARIKPPQKKSATETTGDNTGKNDETKAYTDAYRYKTTLLLSFIDSVSGNLSFDETYFGNESDSLAPEKTVVDKGTRDKQALSQNALKVKLMKSLIVGLEQRNYAREYVEEFIDRVKSTETEIKVKFKYTHDDLKKLKENLNKLYDNLWELNQKLKLGETSRANQPPATNLGELLSPTRVTLE